VGFEELSFHKLDSWKPYLLNGLVILLPRCSCSALAYSMEFQELALEAKFNDSTMISGLYNDLNEEVKDAIAFIAVEMQDAQGYVARCTTLSTSSFCLVVWSARIANRPEKYDEYTQMIILVNNRLFEQRREKQHQSTSGYLHFEPTKETIAPKPKPTIMVDRGRPHGHRCICRIGATDSDRAAERAQCQ
jgi:hypothetical protein